MSIFLLVCALYKAPVLDLTLDVYSSGDACIRKLSKIERKPGQSCECAERQVHK